MWVIIVHLAGFVFCLFTAGAALVRPSLFASRLGLTTVGTDGSNEVRAQYGGFFFATAGVQAGALTTLVSHEAALTLLAAVFGGLIVGRLIDLALGRSFRSYGSTIKLLFAIDTIGMAASASALLALRS